jgi:hypothetical protein
MLFETQMETCIYQATYHPVNYALLLHSYLRCIVFGGFKSQL